MGGKKSIKITLLCLLIGAIIFGAVVGASYLPRRVQQVFSGVELLAIDEGEFEFIRTLDIRINGHVFYGMFASRPRFRGLFEVSGYSFTLGNEIDIFFDEDFSKGSLMYVFAEFPDIGVTSFGTMPRIETLGWVDTDRHFSSLVIWVHEWEPHSDGGYISVNTNRIIVAPAVDINSALEFM